MEQAMEQDTLDSQDSLEQALIQLGDAKVGDAGNSLEHLGGIEDLEEHTDTSDCEAMSDS